jgi:hypothetical protein
MKNLETLRINELLPEQLRSTAQNLIDFLKVYYTQQNTDSAPTQLVDFINSNQDLDRVADDKFISALADSIAKDLPKSIHVERTRLLKRLVDYYNIKGTKRSIEVFFKLFFNKNIRITEPWDSVLIPSDGRYKKNFFIRVVGNSPAAINDTIVGKRVFQRNEFSDITSSALVKSIEKQEYDETIHTLFFDELSITGKFVSNSDLILDNQALLGKIYKTLSNVKVIAGGTNYKIGDRFFLNTNDNTSFELRVDSIDERGTISQLKILNPGAGNTISKNVFPQQINFAIQAPVKSTTIADDGTTVTTETYTTILPEDNLIYKPVVGRPLSNAGNALGLEFEYEYKALVDTFGVTSGIKGRLSDGIVTQDSDFYQKFAYELVTDLPFSSFRKSFDDLIHPTGYKVFNRIRRETTPPIPFGFDKAFVEIKKIGKATLQPGNGIDVLHIYDGRGDPNVDYLGSPAVDRPDEKIPVVASGGVARDHKTRPIATTEIQIKEIFNRPSYPKNNYFMEDFVNDNPVGGGFL